MTPWQPRKPVRMAEKIAAGVDDPTTRVDACHCAPLQHLYYEIPILLHPKEENENE